MSTGASPAGVRPGDEAAASKTIREMFGRVAPRYDLLNRLLSGRIDVYWRSKMVRALRPYLERPEAKVLDLCCGTGDVLLALERERDKRIGGDPRTAVMGSDFCRPMLDGAYEKVDGSNRFSPLIEADAMRFPASDGAFDVITIAYGFRNLAHYRRGLDECRRLLAPGGCLAILEFSQLTWPVFRTLFDFYFRRVLPRIGNSLSGAGDAYSYLQNSVEKFLTPEQLRDQMLAAGFERVEFERLTGGISCLHLAYREEDPDGERAS